MEIYNKIKDKTQKWLESEGLMNRFAWEAILKIKKIFNLNRLYSKDIIKDYFNNHDIRKIQFGSGDDLLDGFLNTDIIGRISLDITKKLPFDDNSVDLFYSNHTLEHIYFKDSLFFLKETYNKLKPGGIHIISVPSIEKISKLMYSSEDTDLRNKVLKSYSDLNEKITPAIFLNRVIHIRYLHKFLYDLDTIKMIGEKIGYEKVYLLKKPVGIDPVIIEKIKKTDEICQAITDIYILIK